MSNEIETGGPAFPVFIAAGHADPKQVAEACRKVAGLSVRDYLAANAPITCIDANQSLLQQPDAARFATCDHDGAMPMPLIMKELVRLRWEYADAMLAAREGEA